MKSVFLIILLAIFSSGITYGQFSVRPQIGVNFASLNYESVHGSVEGRTGLHVGVDLQIGPSLYFQPGLHFSTTKLQIEDFGEINVSELNVPVMLGYKITPISKAFGVRVFAGPNFAYHINKNIDSVFTDITKDDIKDFQIAGIVGGGLDLSIFFVDIGYKFGLSKFFESDVADESVQYFMGNVGLRIGF